MTQYRDGTVDVTNGSLVVAGTGTAFLANASAGDIFTVVGDNVWYEIASVDSDLQITLAANYGGATQTGAAYAITRDFTVDHGFPFPQQGDIETASLFRRAMQTIDALFTKMLGASETPEAAQDALGVDPAGHFRTKPETPESMSVVLTAGRVFDAGTGAVTETADQTLGPITAPAADPRIDRVVYDTATGAGQIVAGAEAPAPSPPAVPAGKRPSARVSLVVGQTEIKASDITEERVLF